MPVNAVPPKILAELRKEIIGNRHPVLVIAQVNHQAVRTVYDVLSKHPEIPTIKLGTDLYVDPHAYAAVRGRRREPPHETECAEPPPPRRPGRPPKVRP
jgi:hypothetical protein